jgi:hypothetical protein
MPMPRLAGWKSSGIEITRIRTRIVAIEPRTMTTRLSGTVAGRSMPAA